MSQKAVVTIVSKNYIPAARVLATSFREHEPDCKFYVLLVDRLDEYFDPQKEPFTLIDLTELRLPRFDHFVYQYSIMELNTAVKPFVLEWLFSTTDCEQLLYIDPDIEVYRPLDAIWDALSKTDIVLTPHMRRPFYDDQNPSDVGILTSGTYNLGFLGLSRSESAFRLLEWWQEKLYTDCVVDIPRGLFVDQKWMDLIPGFFPRTTILHDPSYNVAYWNLHERSVTRTSEGYFVDGIPLAFFHFSGFSPARPDRMSKHQARHDLAALPAVRELFTAYGHKLLAAGYEEASSWPYAFEKLPNGIDINAFVQLIIRRCISNNIAFPSPLQAPDAFRRFLFTVNSAFSGHTLAPIQYAVAMKRSDVAAAFPGIWKDPQDPGFNGWMRTQGVSEESLGSLMRAESAILNSENLVARVFNDLHAKKRSDVFDVFKDMWFDENEFDKFLRWIKLEGARELNFTTEQADAVEAAREGPRLIFGIYFCRHDLQALFAALHDPAVADRLCKWLLEHQIELKVSVGQVTLFREFLRLNGRLARLIALNYNDSVRVGIGGVPTLYDLGDPECPASALGDRDSLVTSLTDSTYSLGIPDQAWIYLFNRRARHQVDLRNSGVDSIKIATPAKAPKIGLAMHKQLTEASRSENRGGKVLNLAGHFDTPIGMGESGRSMARIAALAGFDVNRVTLPTQFDEGMMKAAPLLFGMPKAGSELTISVCNADSVALVRKFLPRHFWGKKNIAFWVWETDRLPYQYREQSLPFDEIWTPSKASAEAIARTVPCPVRVLPHALDFESLNAAKADRAAFGLPENQVLFGYFFDPKSAIERKNPVEHVRAFREAFGDDPSARLVIKVNDQGRGKFEYEKFRAEADRPNITVIEKTLSRADTLRLMASLDVYVSLHRFEGFGLTCAEAMAMGKPVIATAYSGNMDFMTDENSCLVPAEIMETDRPYGPYPRGSRWAYPDLAVAAKHFTSLTDAKLRMTIGERARAHVTINLSVEGVAKRMKELLNGGVESTLRAVS